MPFQEVPAKIDDYARQEHDVLQLWKDTDAFRTLRRLRAGQPRWSFLDGPVTANNPLGVHHGWGRTYKDVFSRFWTMRGRELRYQERLRLPRTVGRSGGRKGTGLPVQTRHRNLRPG